MDPVTRYILPIDPGSASLGQWTLSHDYQVWTDCRAAADPPLTLWEARGRGVIRIPHRATLMHVVSGGTPFHIEHLFGYWRQCDSDLMWLSVTRGEWIRYALVIGGTPGAWTRDRLLWICPGCGEALSARDFATGPKGIERFWTAEREAVGSFNATFESRRCPSCGRVHPPAFEFRNPGAATPEPSW